ncbi:class I SAM-dependent methyltransferase [Endozoicomonas arenosclerae]|uniref:class I SAM-dependent methyltransferase n=1 Tax=Endozoicomonas arenosclerae TaxID=1633495 RepID=UPI000784DCE5|nr:class I SAM-dependent methyltransferase [Endozoicomonas arenosclerae]
MEYTPEKARGYVEEKNHLGFLTLRDLPGLLEKYVKTGTKALDYGCGAGMMMPLIKRCGFDVEGMDISLNMLNIAMRDHKNTAFTHIDSASIPRPDEHYDLVLICYVLVEISSLSEMEAITREVHRVLKPGGIAVVIVSSEQKFSGDWMLVDNDFPENQNLTSGSRVKCRLGDSKLVFEDYFWTDKDYRSVFTRSGLKVLKWHQPLGREEDGLPWKDELHSPLFSIYVLGR